MTQKEQTMEQAKRSYDFLYKCGMESEYPQLTGDWEEDKDFWFEEHCEQMERMKDQE